MGMQKKIEVLGGEAKRCEYEIAKLRSELSKRHFEVAKASERRMKAIAEESMASHVITKIRRHNALLVDYKIKKIENEIKNIEFLIGRYEAKLHLIRSELNDELHSMEAISEVEERARLEELSKDSDVEQFNSSGSFEEVYDYPPIDGAFHIVTGVNGTGKSRYLKKLVDYYQSISYYQKIICLSGTMYEKFPNRNTANKNAKKIIACEYLYFGSRSTNNVFSERRPFRTLVSAMLSDGYNGIQGSLAGDLFNEIGFERTIVFEFSLKSTLSDTAIKGKGKSRSDLNLYLDLSETLQSDELSDNVYQKLRRNIITLSDIKFRKSNQSVSLRELSSGERLYLLAIMSLSFCVSERTLVLFDEPENSLHPQWQAKIIQDIVTIHEKLTKKCTVVIATHSPLIVSSAPNKVSYIRDLPSEEPWVKSDLFGQNSDSVLADQFGVMSARSIKATQLIQECLTSMVDVELNPDRFIKAVDNLKSTSIIIQDGDPLKSALTKIFEIRERYT